MHITNVNNVSILVCVSAFMYRIIYTSYNTFYSDSRREREKWKSGGNKGEIEGECETGER